MATAELDIRIRSGDVPNATRELQRLERQGRSTEQSVGSLTDTAGHAAGTIRRLTGAVAGLSAAMAASEVIKYADAWTTVSNKLVNSVKDHETLAQVQDRVFAIAQESRSSLEATATLYGRLSSATAEYIKEGETIGGMVETIAKAMSVSGATTSEAEGAIVQLSQAFGAGALRGEEFNSVNEAAPRLMQALADSLGVARGQLKSMAAEGELTTEVLYNAWNGQSKAAAQIQSEFEKMSVTAEANIAKAQNNLTKWIGENEAAVAVTKAYGDAAVGLSNNLDTLADAGTALAAVMGARLAGGLAQATTAKVSAAAASRALAVAELNGAKAATTAASAEVALLQAQVANWTQRIKGAATENQASRFRERLAADTALLTGAENSLTAATSRLSAAQAGAAVTGKAMSGAMALLGGPIGVAVLAASAIFAFSSRANEAADPTATLTDRVRQLTSSMKELSVAEVDKTIGEVEQQLVRLNARANMLNLEGAIVPEGLRERLQTETDAMLAMYRKLMEQRKKILSGADLGKPEDVNFISKSAGSDFNKRMSALNATALQKAAETRNEMLAENELMLKKDLISKADHAKNAEEIQRAYAASVARINAPEVEKAKADARKREMQLQSAQAWLERTNQLGATELEQIEYWQQQELAKLREFEQQKLLIPSEAHSARVAIVEEAARREIELQDKVLQKSLEASRLKAQAEQQATTQMASMQWGLASQSLDAISMAAEEGSTMQKAAFIAGKGMAAAQAIMQAELASVSTLAAYAAAAAAAGPGGPALLAAGTAQAAAMKTMGYASAAIIAAQGFAGMFDNGGNISSGQWGIVGENGPEIVKGPVNVTSRKKTAAMAASAMDGGSVGTVINLTQNIYGNGDEALAKVVRQASDDALNRTQQDFAGNGRLRKTLGV